ncbi:MAG: 16S rRNA methyltransferase [Pyrobaculum sp.]
MILVLAESALELVPPELWRHPAVVADARRRGRRPGEVLLDRSRHHPAMGLLKDAARRGRPDIVHQALLAFQYSPLVRRGLGAAYVHTRGDFVIEVKPGTRIPKNYNNFVALVEQLFKVGRAPPEGEPLLILHRMDLATLLAKLGGRWAVMHERGAKLPLCKLGEVVKDRVVVVGGFPHGDFDARWVVERADAAYSLGEEPLDAAQVVCKITTAAECALGML